MTMPDKRYMSAQAWRRLRSAMSDSELADLARDLGAWAGLTEEQTDEVSFALTSLAWEGRKQA